MLDIIKKHFEDFAASNWDGYRATLSSDTVYDEVSTEQRVQGADEVVRAVQRWKRVFPDITTKVIDIIASGDQVVAEVEWEGTHRGALVLPVGTFPATNRRGRARAVFVYTLRNGKITQTRHYFDLLGLLRQLGVIQPLGAPRPAAEEARTPARH